MNDWFAVTDWLTELQINENNFMTDWMISDWLAEIIHFVWLTDRRTDQKTERQMHWLATETDHLTDRLKHDSLGNWRAKSTTVLPTSLKEDQVFDSVCMANDILNMTIKPQDKFLQSYTLSAELFQNQTNIQQLLHIHIHIHIHIQQVQVE